MWASVRHMRRLAQNPNSRGLAGKPSPRRAGQCWPVALVGATVLRTFGKYPLEPCYSLLEEVCPASALAQ
eukprot:363237-Chlamydomonas_euryale.AAC.7